MASIGSRGDKLDLLFRQGATFGPVPVSMTAPEGEPIDLTGCLIRSKIRKSYQSATAYEVDCSLTDAAGGKFVFSVTDETTALMPCGPTPNDAASVYVWDLEIEFPDGTVMPVFFGSVKVAPEATK